MFSSIAKIDLEQLRKSGYQPTDEEVVKLNDLGVRIERGKDITPANMPRIAFAGNQILHEPTVGAEEWWLQYGRDAAWTDRGRLMTYFFMLAHAKDVELLSSLQKASDIRKAVKQWMKECSATENELWRALMWVKCGSEDIKVDEDKKIQTSLEDEKNKDALWMTVIACAGALGVSPAELETYTQSELNGMLVRANMMARIPMKPSVARDYMAYQQILREIEDRGRNG